MSCFIQFLISRCEKFYKWSFTNILIFSIPRDHQLAPVSLILTQASWMYLINSTNGRLKKKWSSEKKPTQVRYKCSHIENVVVTRMLVTMLCLQPLSPTSVTNIDVARYNRLDHYLFTDCIIPAVLNQNDYVTIFSQTIFGNQVSSSVSIPSSNVEIQVRSSILESVKRKLPCLIFHHFSAWRNVNEPPSQFELTESILPKKMKL